MTNTNALYSLISPAYLNRAIAAARARRFGEAEQYLNWYSELQPNDHQGPLLRAKIYHREGRISDCLSELREAAQLGHDSEENSRMVQALIHQDHHRYRRQEFRTRVKMKCRSLLRLDR
jgi:hypothetical protein